MTDSEPDTLPDTLMDPACDRFIEAMGLIAQAEGSSRISGQIIGLLILADTPLSLNDIAQELSISKASASTNTRLLETRGIAQKVARKGTRQDLWEANSQPHRHVLPVMAQRFRRHAETVDGIASDFAGDHAHKARRVQDMALFYRDSADFLEKWHAQMSTALAADDSEEMDY